MKKILFIILIFIISCTTVPKGIQLREIPFFRQTSGGNCLQTQSKMILKYYYPEKDYSFELLDELSGRTPGKWTWTSQITPVLINEGLDIHYYSDSPYTEILEKGEEFILEFYGEEDGQSIIKYTNFDSLYGSIELLGNEYYTQKKITFEEVEEEFNKGNNLIIVLDLEVLYKTGKPYSGHFVTVTGITEEHVYFHNSAKRNGANTKVNKEDFIAAWNANGTDNDVIIIKGKI